MLDPNHTQFLLSAISHEIRNPITLIGSYLQLLENKHPELSDDSYWQTICQEMDHLKFLLNDFTSYRNSMVLRPAQFDAALFFKEYQHTIELLTCGIPNMELRFSLDENLPVLCADPHKIRQLLDNLIRNSLEALECAEEKELALSAHYQDSTLFISVQDNGCGIEEEQLSHLFDPFVTHKPSGTGLGLAICHQIAQAHGGSIRVSCESGYTEFLVTLPIENRP